MLIFKISTFLKFYIYVIIDINGQVCIRVRDKGYVATCKWLRMEELYNKSVLLLEGIGLYANCKGCAPFVL